MSENRLGDAETEQVSGDYDGEYLRTTLELSVRSPSGDVRRFPLHRTVTRIGPAHEKKINISISAGPTVRFNWLQGRLFYNRVTEGVVLRNQQDEACGEFVVGDVLQLGDYVVELHDRAHSVRATLECYSDPFYARIWPIEATETTIGRSGKRQNGVVLEHPTVSREHATLVVDAAGPSLRCESSGLMMIDGEKVPQGQSAHIKDGDLVQLGELLFRFRLVKDSEPPAPIPTKLKIQSLGGFSVWVGGSLVPEKSWRTQAMKWLLARLALEWGRPVATEVLLELFWPDLPPDKSKNNLNYTVSTLRQLLRGSDTSNVDFLLRTNQSLQLNPDILGEHDVSQLQSLLQQATLSSQRGRDQRSWEALESALQLWQGPYLEDCYMDWADLHRTRLQRECLEAGQQLLEFFQQNDDWDGVLNCANRLLKIDECCQEAYLARMRCHNGRKHFQETVKEFQLCRDVLQRQLSLDPDPAVIQEYEMALSQC